MIVPSSRNSATRSSSDVRRSLALADRRRRMARAAPRRRSAATARRRSSGSARATAPPGERGGAGRADEPAVLPYGESEANRICPGGTSENSVVRSAGIHQAVSNSRFGRVRRGAPDPGEVADPGVREDQPRVGKVLGELDRVQPERGDPASGVDQDRQPALVRERDQLADRRMVERELLGAGVKLDPLRAGVETALGLAQCVVGVRVDAAERHQQPVRRSRRLDHHVVGRRVAVGLVHREHERADAHARA